jgi:hypothetical protein
MAEQRTFNPLVQGSTPWRPTCSFRVPDPVAVAAYNEARRQLAAEAKAEARTEPEATP